MSVNKVILLGRLTRDVELKSLPTGMSVCNAGLATNQSWKDKQGVKQEKTEFHNIVFFGKQADVVSQYASKGSELYLEGRLQTRAWDAKDGTKKYTTEVVVDNFQFVGSKRKDSDNSWIQDKLKPNNEMDFTTENIPF